MKKHTRQDAADLIKQVTNHVQHKKFIDEVGSKAIVSRSEAGNERTLQLREVLSDIGRDLLEAGVVPQGMEYKGSFACHIFIAPTLGEVAYFHQKALDDCPEALVGPGVSDLRGDLMEHYGRRRQKKRSGF